MNKKDAKRVKKITRALLGEPEFKVGDFVTLKNCESVSIPNEFKNRRVRINAVNISTNEYYVHTLGIVGDFKKGSVWWCRRKNMRHVDE